MEVDTKYEKIFFFLRNKNVIKIIDFLLIQEEGMKLTKISEHTKMHYNILKKYINILIQLDVIIKDDSKRLYRLNHYNYNRLLKATS